MNDPNVVLVEDDRDIREVIQEVLHAEGYSVMAFENGKEALDHLTTVHAPCVILLDIMMPVMDGWEFLKARKSLGSHYLSTPVYIVSANASADEVQKSDANGFIRKPLDIELLLSIVRGHCHRRPESPRQSA